MKTTHRQLLAGFLTFSLVTQPVATFAEDIDIFAGDSAGTAGVPNVLFVLDNTSNWARQAQHWPSGEQQGQSEVAAIKEVVNSMDFNKTPLNIGVMEFVTEGNSGDNGGFVRLAVKPMSVLANRNLLNTKMDNTYNNITSPTHKRNSGEAYGNLFYDVFNYFKGANQSQSGAGTPSSLADTDGYITSYSKFKSPLDCGTVCAKNFIIFISNPDQSGPTHDDSPSTPGNTQNLSNLGGDTAQLSLPNFTSQTTTTTENIDYANNCTTLANCTTTDYSSKCSGTDPYYSSCACDSSNSTTVAPSCPAGQSKYTINLGSGTATGVDTGSVSGCLSNTNGTPTCPTGYTNCTYGAETADVCSPASKHKYKILGSTTLPAATTYTSSCTASVLSGNIPASSSDYTANNCASRTSCTYGAAYNPSGTCAAGTARYMVKGTLTTTTNTPTGTATLDTAPYNLDEWTRFLYKKGISFQPSCDDQKISTYTIDVYNAQPNATHTALMLSAARAGGGKYFNATSKTQLINALKQIFAEILSVNSTFASASLPVNATNRAQNENQVFIGMFRPDQETKPRWFGNLKRFQIIKMATGTDYDLGDVNGSYAVNTQTGFLADCATSWWTSDSPLTGSSPLAYYWSKYPIKPDPFSNCPTITSGTGYSDLPDGPTVEKGAVAEVIRKGNNPPVTNTSPTWLPNRTLYTTSGALSTALSALSSASLTATQKSWIGGADTEDENSDGNKTETRASIHGDVVHSRPVPVNYGSSIVVYYGSNDGVFRAVDAGSGKELWGIIPYEFSQSSFVDRLSSNAPLIKYPSTDMSIIPTPKAKDYGWDGSVGLYQNLANSKIWIYPTQRRGGSLIYALNVTSSSSPSIMWKHGCYAGSCTGGFSNMGQSWSTPNIAPVLGYTNEKVAFFGGGYDTCEDDDTDSPSCSSPKGASVYAVDAASGTLLKSFTTTRSVAADISVVDMNGDGQADYAYAADTGGNLYRISMSTYSSASGSPTYSPLSPASWSICKIGEAGGSRKFLFSPAVVPIGSMGKSYIAIGSGDREHPLASNYAFDITNRFYVYLDDVNAPCGAPFNLNTNNVTTDPGCSSTTAVLPTGAYQSWYMDLNQYGQGEQTVTSPLIMGGMIAFSTNRPIPPAAGTCANALGEARGYWVNLTNGSGAIGVGSATCGGSRSSTFPGGGLPPSPVTGVVPIDGKPVTIVIGAVQRSGTGVNTPISGQRFTPTPDPTRKRAYWKNKGVD